MASVGFNSFGGNPVKAPAGTSYDPTLGGFVSALTKAKNTQDLGGASAPQYNTSPLGEVDKFVASGDGGSGGSWQNVGQLPGTGPKAAQGLSQTNPEKLAAYNALASQIQGSTGYTPTPLPDSTAASDTSTTDAAGDAAAYGQAKERGALETQSALKGLQEHLASMGLAGSGAAGVATGKVYEQGLTNLADTDRQLAEQHASQAFTASQSAASRNEGAREFNANFNAGQQKTASDVQSQKYAQLIALLGGLY